MHYFFIFLLYFIPVLAISSTPNSIDSIETSQYTSEKGPALAELIANNSVKPVYNVNTEQLKTLIHLILVDNKQIKALTIIDSIDDSPIINFYRDGDKMIYDKIPQEIKTIKKYTHNINYDNEEIGKVVLYYQDIIENKIKLTDEERKWINTQTIKIGIEPWPPIVYLESNQAKGIAGDFLNKVIEKTGLKVQLTSASWNELLTAFKAGDIDVLPDSYYVEGRTEYGLFSKPYFVVKENIYVKSNNKTIRTLNDLQGKIVALEKDYGTIAQIKALNLDIDIIETENFEETVKLVLNGKADAFIEPIINAQSFFREHSVTGLRGFSDLNLKSNKLHLFSKKDSPILASILQKGLDAISNKEKQEVINHWIIDDEEKVLLSDKEQQWLDKNIPIRYVYDIDWEPLERINEVGQHVGIIADIIHLIKTKTGLNFIPIQSESWNQAVSMAKGRTADMYSGVGATEARKQYMNFSTETIFATDYIFVSRNNEDYLSGFDDIKNKKLAVVRNYTIHDILKENMPQQPVLTVDNLQAGMTKLVNNEIDILVVNAVTAKHFLKLPEYQSLKMAYKTRFKLNLHIGVRNDWPPEVLSIIDKALKSISANEVSEIYSKWTKVTQKIDYSLLIKVVIGFVVLMALFIFWNRKQAAINKKQATLITEVLEMKEQLTNEVADRKQTETIAEHAKQRLENITNNIPGVVYQLQVSHGQIVVKFISDGIKILHQLEPNDVLQDFNCFIQSVYPEDQAMVLAKINEATKKISNISLEYRVIHHSGTGINTQDTFKNSLIDITENDNLISCSEKSCAEEACTQNYCLENAGDQVRWIKLEATIAEISNDDNDVLLFEEADEIKDIQFNGNLIDITESKLSHAKVVEQQNEIASIHRHTRESIEYAALIQSALIPDNKLLHSYFSDSFAIWHPKDIVGGDIYLVEPISEHELVMMVIDCTGHGVPGAFVTMLVKAIERQLMANINQDEYVSPAKILSIFNRSIKHLLKQESIDSISNAGFDGSILYYNKKEKVIRFAGAESPLFIIQDEQLKVIKGNRHSIGYKKSDINYQFTDHEIDVSIPTKLYLTTDGFLDQNGGNKGFCFGKKRFKNLITENANYSFADQQELFLSALHEYQGEEERNDDVTVVGLSINDNSAIEETFYDEILNFNGVITQNFISSCLDNINYRIDDMTMMSNVSTVVIEICQNIINYSKTEDIDCAKIDSTGLIEVRQGSLGSYRVKSKSIISVIDKEKLEKKLIEIQSMDRSQIRKRYRELRRAGKEKHDKGAGIGLYEIAKLISDLKFEFKKVNRDKFEYHLDLLLEAKKKD